MPQTMTARGAAPLRAFSALDWPDHLLVQHLYRSSHDSPLEGDGFELSVPDRSAQRNTNSLPRRKIRTGSKPWPISHQTGRSHALPSRRLPMEKVTRLDGRFRYLRAVSMGGVMQRGLGRHCHCTEEGGRNPKASTPPSSPVGSPELREGLM